MKKGLVNWYSITPAMLTHSICFKHGRSAPPQNISCSSRITPSLTSSTLPHGSIQSVWWGMRGQVNVCLAYLALNSGNIRLVATPQQMELRVKGRVRDGEIGEVWWVAKLQVSEQQKKIEEVLKPKPTPKGVISLKRHQSNVWWKENMENGKLKGWENMQEEQRL